MAMRISASEIEISSSSYVDSAGRVFSWQGRIFRGIAPDHIQHFQALLQSGVFKRLVERKMVIESWVPAEQFEGFDFVLEHRRIPYISYCVEWTPSMLKDAALLTLRIAQELAEHDFTLQDAYPWNVLFEGPVPRFVDIGSFVPARDDMLWIAYDQFCNFFLYPLYLYSAGLYDVARPLLFDYLQGVSHVEWRVLMPLPHMICHPLRYVKLAMPHAAAQLAARLHLEDKVRKFSTSISTKRDIKRARQRFFASLIKEVEAIQFLQPRSHWSRYYAQRHESYSGQSRAQKEQLFSKIIADLQPTSLLDVGTNTGEFAKRAADQVPTVIGIDDDMQCVEQLYTKAKDARLPILPLMFDALNPTPAFGWRSIQFPSAIERLRMDAVCALALIHHLAIGSRQGFGRAIDVLEAFTKFHLVLEWVGPQDPKVKMLMNQTVHSTNWYTFENFETELRARFGSIEIFEPHAPGRQFIVCQR